MFPVEKFRSQFPLLVHPPSTPFIYADSAATTQKPQVVIDEMTKFYQTSVANVHRGAYQLSERASALYEQARQYIQELLGAHQCIFVKGATEGLNFLSRSLAHHLKSGDHLLLSIAEHHANIVCWQQLALEKNLTIHYAPLDLQGCIDIEYCQNLLSQYPIRLVSLVHVSNTVGTLQPLEKIFSMAKSCGAITIADCCQSLPLYREAVRDLKADYCVFSGHKIYAPSGIGCLLIKEEEGVEKLQPYQTGGGMIAQVTTSHTTFAPAPACFEAGTPFIEGAHLLAVALKFIAQYDSADIKEYLDHLTKRATDCLMQIGGVKSFYLHNVERSPIFALSFENIHAHDLATYLDSYGICARAGHHCTMPLVRELESGSLLRLSFNLYNTGSEIETCFTILAKAREFFHGR